MRLPPADGTFVAIDFETADSGADSACAVGLVRVERLRIVETKYALIRPPRSRVRNAFVHGLTWPMLRDAELFCEIWPSLTQLLDSANHLVAHNANFDRHVLRTCCEVAGIAPPAIPFVCTVKIARQTWNQPSNRLPVVCARLGIELQHHNALSDAEACARILIAAHGMTAFEALNTLF